MIKMIRGHSYIYKDVTFFNGQTNIRLQPDIEASLVMTGQFEYVGAPKVVFIKPNTTTNEVNINGTHIPLTLNKPVKLDAHIAYELIRLGFGKEIPLRNVLAEDSSKIEHTLFIRDGGLGDLFMLSTAFKYLMDLKNVKKINFMTQTNYMSMFEQEQCFNLFSLDDYESKAGKFDYVLDLRQTVEGDMATGSMNRLPLFMRFLGLNIDGKKITDFTKYTRMNYIPNRANKHLEHLKGTSVIINAGTSRPERNLLLQPLVEFIDKLAANKLFDKIILIHHQRINKKFDSDKVINLSANTSIMEMMDIIHEGTYYFGLDTGPSHIAGAFGKTGLVVGGAVNMDLRYPQYGTLKTLQMKMECVLNNTCYSCNKGVNPSMPGKCMEFNSETLYTNFMEALR